MARANRGEFAVLRQETQKFGRQVLFVSKWTPCGQAIA
jgi:hypothetical protein